jgi:hypothetical protein
VGPRIFFKFAHESPVRTVELGKAAWMIGTVPISTPGSWGCCRMRIFVFVFIGVTNSHTQYRSVRPHAGQVAGSSAMGGCVIRVL